MCLEGCGFHHRASVANQQLHDPLWLERERQRLLAENAALKKSLGAIKKALGIVEIPTRSEPKPWGCEHANECPQMCPCPPGCYCSTRTCKGR